MTLREAATSLAARIPTQVKLLFATLSPPPPPLAEDVDVSFKTSTPASIHPAPASAAEPTQAMSMDERLSQARHSKGAPSLTSLTSPRVMRPEDI